MKRIFPQAWDDYWNDVRAMPVYFAVVAVFGLLGIGFGLWIVGKLAIGFFGATFDGGISGLQILWTVWWLFCAAMFAQGTAEGLHGKPFWHPQRILVALVTAAVFVLPTVGILFSFTEGDY